MSQASVFVLTGGRSSRMGQDKAFLEFGGETLLSRALRLARSVASDVHLVGAKAKFSSYGDVVEDVYPNHGPLGGIHAALRSSSSDQNLVLAVDMPLLQAPLLSLLLERANESGAIVTVPHLASGWQPLCAVYRREFADAAERALQADSNKIDPLFADVTLAEVTEQDLSRLGFTADAFRNLNTPEDLRSARPEPHP
jgi:molybdopterin-guanine dinucleotide biosynthesis protein A